MAAKKKPLLARLYQRGKEAVENEIDDATDFFQNVPRYMYGEHPVRTMGGQGMPQAARSLSRAAEAERERNARMDRDLAAINRKAKKQSQGLP